MPHTTPDTLLRSRAIKLTCRLSAAALGSAVVVGALATAFMYLRVVPLIIEAETFEVEELPDSNATVHAEAEAEEWAPADGAERCAYTFVSNVAISLAFALMLNGVAILEDRHVSTLSGLQRGAAGWTIFMALPCAGLAPELPGMAAASLDRRQWWWLYAVLLSATGLTVILVGTRRAPPMLRASGGATGADVSALRAKQAAFYAKSAFFLIAGVILAAIPHLTGAPHPHLAHDKIDVNTTCDAGHVPCERPGPPSEMAAAFAVWCLATCFAYWLVLGVVCTFAFNLSMGYEAPLPHEIGTVSVNKRPDPCDAAESSMEAL